MREAIINARVDARRLDREEISRVMTVPRVRSTTVGAEGLAYTPGEDILIADDGPAFAEAVASVLADDGLARRLAAGGRRTVEQCYAWQRVYPAWDAVYAAREGQRV